MPIHKKRSHGRPGNHSIVEAVFRKTLITYIMNTLTWAVGMLVDGAFIGNFLGVDAVAAYGMIWPLTLVFGLIGGVLSGGSRNLYTNLAGHGKMEEANHVFTLACLMAFAVSGLMIVVIHMFSAPLAGILGANGENAHLQPLISSYLIAFVLGLPFDSTGRILSGYMGMDSDHSRVIYATVAMTVADIAGDAVAVFVFHGGMFAMGLTTAIGQMVWFFVLSTHFTRKKRMLRFTFRGLGSELNKIGKILASGAPVGVTRIASAIGGIAINHIIAAAASSSFIAAYSVHKSMGSLVGATYLGIADTVWTLSSIYFGEEDRKALDELQRTAFRFGIPITGVVALVLFLFPRPFASIYLGLENAEALALGSEALRLFAVSIPLYMIVYMFVDYLMGVEKLRTANIYSLFLECGAIVPVVWVMVKLFGGRGAWFATPVTLFIMVLSTYLIINREGTGNKFNINRLLVTENFGPAAGKELNISADTMTEVIGMSRLAGLFCQENGISKKKAYALALCIEELGGNVIKHGFDDGKPHSIDIRMLIKDDELILRIRDDCRPFNLLEQYEILRHQPEDKTRNVGIRMVVESCRDIKYLSTMNTNNLIIRI